MIQFLFFFALVFSPVVQCWGEIGHRAVGYLALKHLDPAGKALFEELIKPNAKFDVSDGAVWADLQTFKFPFTKPWHYVNAESDPPKTCSAPFSDGCPHDKGGCIISAIKNMTARVNDINLSQDEQGKALKFLLHFVGDIHQPLHTEKTCKGGTEIMVTWDDKIVKLHSVWDAEIIKKLLRYRHPSGPDHENVYDKFLAKGWATALDDDSTIRVDDAGVAAIDCVDVTDPVKCAAHWAIEANKFICSFVLKDGSKADPERLGGDPDDDDDEKCHWKWNGPSDLADEYYDGAVPIVKMQVKKAGLRLAAWVNGIAAQRAILMNSGPGMKVQGQEL